MIHSINRFGEGDLHQAQDLKGSMYVACTACMSIYAEFLSWANANTGRFAMYPMDADCIIVLSCQVTDLAVLNDLRTLETLMEMVPGKTFYIGGCLAKRFDIALPARVRRLVNVFSDHTPIDRKLLVDWRPPFWVKDFSEQGNGALRDGHLFREMYPLRIGVGCKGHCTYCTIKTTRGEYREIAPDVEEFLNHDDVVLIADAPTERQIIEWCGIAKKFNKPISLRNVEPAVAEKCMSHVKGIAFEHLLNFFHSPIQSPYQDVLKDMGRNVGATLKLMDEVKSMRALGVVTATNVIIDYKQFPNPRLLWLKATFDYISWNPYWDGNWNREKAEARFEKYFG